MPTCPMNDSQPQVVETGGEGMDLEWGCDGDGCEDGNCPGVDPRILEAMNQDPMRHCRGCGG